MKTTVLSVSIASFTQKYLSLNQDWVIGADCSNTSCETCELSGTNCITCSPNSNLIGTLCGQCDFNFIYQNGLCTCASPCETCSSRDSTDCITCVSQFYFDPVSSPKCQACNNMCQTCNGPLLRNCLTCISFATINPLTQNCECIFGYVYNSTAKSCSTQGVCDNTCLSCDPSNSQTCYVCKSGFDLTTQKMCECRSTRFFNSSSDACEDCSINCLTCSSLSVVCTSCQNDQELQDSFSCKSRIPSISSQETIEEVKYSAKSASTIALGITTASSVMFSFSSPSGSSISQQFLSLQKLFFLMLIEITYTNLLQSFFSAMSGSSPFQMMQSINIFSKIEISSLKDTKVKRVLDQTASTDIRALPKKFTSESISSSALINAGGAATCIFIIWVIFLPQWIFECQQIRAKQKLSLEDQQAIFQASLTTAGKVKELVQKFTCMAVIILHEVLSLVLCFSITIQLTYLSLHSDSTSQSYFIAKLTFVIIVILYLAFVFAWIVRLANSEQLNQEQLQAEFKQKQLYNILFDFYIENQQKEGVISRNNKLILLTIENILVPIIITVFFDNFRVQIVSWIVLQISLFFITVLKRPRKDHFDNVKLIFGQLLWILVLFCILKIALVTESINQNNQQYSKEDINKLESLNNAVIYLVYVILYLDPLISFIKASTKLPILVNKLKEYLNQKRTKKFENRSLPEDPQLSIQLRRTGPAQVFPIDILIQQRKFPQAENSYSFENKSIDQSIVYDNSQLQPQKSFKYEYERSIRIY